MYNFFVDESNKKDDRYFIGDSDYNHIKNVLRMNIGDSLLVSCNDVSDLCKIESFDSGVVTVSVTQKNYQTTNLPVKIHLFQGLPKSDKLELIIQKAVELGAASVTPVVMKRCVVKIDDKKRKSKIQRWQAIAEAAAKQSKRTSVPRVCDIVTYKQMLETLSNFDAVLVPYECAEGMSATRRALKELKSGDSVAVVIGSEGGFEPSEIDLITKAGGKIISLGSRILRTETAAITALSMLMLYSETELEK